MCAERVVVTGIGVVSPLGVGKDLFWEQLLAGKSGVGPITRFDSTGYATHIAAEVTAFFPDHYMNFPSQYGRASQYAIAATQLALTDAHLAGDQLPEIGLYIGTTLGNFAELETLLASSISPSQEAIDSIADGILAMNVQQELGIANAHSVVFPQACSAGNFAIGYGFDQIRYGQLDIAIVGGTDALSKSLFAGFGRLMSLAKDHCQPFDLNRDGLVIGEGAGVLILESFSHAQKRSAPIYAELLGYASNCDAAHMTVPHLPSITRLIQLALKNSAISPDSVSYIQAHGTGTRMNDKTESDAISTVFGLNQPYVTAIKSSIGHTMGAASVLGAVSAVLSIRDSKIPPTIHFNTPDPDCSIRIVSPATIDMDVKTVLNLSYAFGGNNAATVFTALSPHILQNINT